MNCLGMPSRDTGHSRVPEPPARSTGTIRVSGIACFPDRGGTGAPGTDRMAVAPLACPSRSERTRHVQRARQADSGRGIWIRLGGITASCSMAYACSFLQNTSCGCREFSEFRFLVVPSAKLQRDTASRFGKSALAVPTSGIAPKLYGFSSRRVQSFNSGGYYLPLIRNPLYPFALGAPRSPT